MQKKFKAIIVDDEQGSIEALEWELKNFPFVEVIATFQYPADALKTLDEGDFDVLFLDIEMPQLNGFSLLKKLERVDFTVIFTTAYDQFAIQAIKANALDYLLKPVSEEDLSLALDKLRCVKDTQFEEDKLAKLLEQLSASESFSTVALPTMEGLEFIEKDDIIHCESTSNYTNIYTIGEKKILISKTLKDVTALLNGEQFFRVHNSYVVNLNHIRRYIRGKGGELVLKNGKHIPVSRSRKEGLMRLF